jgi:hypothetical protein
MRAAARFESHVICLRPPIYDFPLALVHSQTFIDFSITANATLVTITNNIGLIARMCAVNEKIDKVGGSCLPERLLIMKGNNY